MKMIWATIRPEVLDRVVRSLAVRGYLAMTRFDVYGRGKQRGVIVGGESYDLPKTVLMMVVEDSSVDEAATIIEENARTGCAGDGRIFITAVEEARTIRTGERGL
ncbi:MAG TPA: P-II family nitrogen regulator [Methanothrix sp.]|nr:P-II family nitrogen regulator [Methanothrix sp.]HPT20250.1 P-II family nitrogen regulator [Methanothrix sp.]